MIMKKLLIISVSILCVAGFFSITWAHGPNGGGSSYRGHGYSKPHYSRPSHQRNGGGFSQHLSRNRRHLHKHSFSHSKRHHLRRLGRLKRLPRFGNGVILGRSGRLRTRNIPGPGPIARAYARGIGVSPIMKSQEEKALRQVPHHSLSSRTYHSNNPEPWFLYGKGKEFRQMGLIPSLPQAPQDLK